VKSQLFLSAIVTLMFSAQVKADNAVTEEETLHLLEYIGNSGCTFTRNGKEYQSEKVRSHIQR